MHSSINSGLRKSPNKWTKEENMKLGMLVTKYGEKKWKRISSEMGGQKTGAQCAQHWKRVSSPDIKKGPWDEDEEALLFRMFTQLGPSWKKIAKKISRRTDIQCRYQYLKAKQSREVKWTALEDNALTKKVVEQYDKVVWLEVAEHMAKLKHTSTLRTALECKERYLVLAGVDDVSCGTSRAGYCISVPVGSSSETGDCYGVEQEHFSPPPTRHRFTCKNNSNTFKEFATDFDLQLSTESAIAPSGVIVRLERLGSFVRGSCSRKSCCCSSCSGCKQEAWDCLESLAAVASVLPREMMF